MSKLTIQNAISIAVDKVFGDPMAEDWTKMDVEMKKTYAFFIEEEIHRGLKPSYVINNLGFIMSSKNVGKLKQAFIWDVDEKISNLIKKIWNLYSFEGQPPAAAFKESSKNGINPKILDEIQNFIQIDINKNFIFVPSSTFDEVCRSGDFRSFIEYIIRIKNL